MSSPQRRQRGIAVITAMLVVTIATVLAVQIAWETNLDLRRTESLLSWDQARQYGYGAEAYAARLIEDEIVRQAGGPYTREVDTKACAGFNFTLDQGGMVGGVCDLQGRFNLNNLVGGDGKPNALVVAQFRRLIEAVGALDESLEIGANDAEIIAESAADWIDPDSTAGFNGAEDDTYTEMQPPYRAANFWFTSASELRAVRGVTPEIYTALAPWLAALPVTGQPTTINVNTASVPVLMSLDNRVSQQNAELWIEDSMTNPFEDVNRFTGFVDPAMQPFIGFSSNFFALQGFVSVGNARLGMYSLLESTGQTVTPRMRQFDVVDAVPTEDAQTIDTESLEADAEQVNDDDE